MSSLAIRSGLRSSKKLLPNLIIKNSISQRYKSATPVVSSQPATASLNDSHSHLAQPAKSSISTEPTSDEKYVGMTGGEIFHEKMLEHGVDTVFGYPGGAILPVYDAIHDSKYFKFILPRHEQGGGHMAEGYAKVTLYIYFFYSQTIFLFSIFAFTTLSYISLTSNAPYSIPSFRGKPGVILVTSGPGATNVVTPMQDALSDGVPLIVFSGQVPTPAIGTDAFQEADIVGISRSCTKWNVMVKDIAELPRRIDEAFKIATSGRPGPVLVDLPKNVTGGILKSIKNFSRANIPTKIKNDTALSAENNKSLDEAARLLNNAKRPIIYAGNGVLSHPDGPRLLKEISELTDTPVTTTLLGLGAFDENNERSLHMLGMHGSVYANLAIQKADVILALGARFDDRVTGSLPHFAPAAKEAAKRGAGGIIHFDILAKNINKVVQADIAVESDVVKSMAGLLSRLKKSKHDEWISLVKTWKAKYPFYYEPESSPDALLKPQSAIVELNKQLENRKEDFIISTGVGQHQMWAAQYYRWTTPRSFVTSGGLGTMGFGVPSAIGAQIGAPDKMVINVDGDGSFSMTAMEMATAAEYKIPVKMLLLNNNFQGMVRQWQDLFYDARHSHTGMKNPDFVKLAESMYFRGIRVNNRRDLPAAMKDFLDEKGPVLLEVVCDPREHVYPMAPAAFYNLKWFKIMATRILMRD
ncbi:Acetolactate synthase, mitochondrial [Smittium culicis]|uniref:Acetolactate synthase n=1 Tax=Smittium culicis TaxID=133412 RepID=A0A1R1YBU1_9FUNG|nr:Acetolactate synthase, mitochondrial [Smittium culicis]